MFHWGLGLKQIPRLASLLTRCVFFGQSRCLLTDRNRRTIAARIGPLGQSVPWLGVCTLFLRLYCQVSREYAGSIVQSRHHRFNCKIRGVTGSLVERCTRRAILQRRYGNVDEVLGTDTVRQQPSDRSAILRGAKLAVDAYFGGCAGAIDYLWPKCPRVPATDLVRLRADRAFAIGESKLRNVVVAGVEGS